MNFNSMNEFFQEPKVPELTEITEYEITKQLYQNTRGVNTPKSYMVVLDSRVISSETRENDFVYNKVVFDLCDPIIIDSPTDIYLEFLHFQNTDVSQADGTQIFQHLERTSQFYIDIDEFSINNISNNQFQSSRFYIPNYVYGKTDQNQNDNAANVRTTYLKLKSNYLCQIESNYIRRLTVTIRAEDRNGGDGSDETILYYLSNRPNTNTDNFETYGAVKIGLYFHKK